MYCDIEVMNGTCVKVIFTIDNKPAILDSTEDVLIISGSPVYFVSARGISFKVGDTIESIGIRANHRIIKIIEKITDHEFLIHHVDEDDQFVKNWYIAFSH